MNSMMVRDRQAFGAAMAAVATEPDHYREHRLTTQDGLSLYVREYGPLIDAKTPILCLPGLTRNCRDFHDFAVRHALTRRIVCPDMRGRGRSDHDPNPRNYRPETLLLDVIHMLSTFRLHPCIILGTSLGGLLATGISIVEPRALAGVILNDSSPGSDPAALKHIAAYVAEHKSQPDWETAARYGRGLIGQEWDLDDAGWMRIARNSYSEGPDGLLRLDYDPGIAWPLQRLLAGRGRPRDLWGIFGGLRDIPALALRGAVSNVLSAETLQRMIAEKPDLAHVTVAGIGHAPQLDEPEAQAAIDAFLADV